MVPASDSAPDNSERRAPDSPQGPELRTLALERAVRWEPADQVISSLSVPLGAISAVEPLVVHHQALADIEAHAAASRAFAFGVLYGEIYRCPRLHMNYVLVEGAQRGSLDDAPPNGDLHATLAAVIDRLRSTGVRAVGWYRAGAAVGLHLSSADTRMHAALFPEAWAVALVRDALIVHSMAAFVRLIDRTHPYPVPFYEQLSADGYVEGERPRTAIAWSSYHTMTDVSPPVLPNAPLPLFDSRRMRRTPAARPAVPNPPQPGRAKPFEPVRAVPSTPSPAPAAESAPVEPPEPAPPEPAALSIERIFDPDPHASTQTDPATSPRRRPFRTFSFRPRIWLTALTIAAMAVAVLAAWYFTH